MNKHAKVYVAGHTGLVGSALVRILREEGYDNILTATHAELELCDEAQVRRFIAHNEPEYVFLIAAIVGGIDRNRKNPVNFLLGNLQIQNNVLSAAAGIARKVMFMGSSCIYPKLCPQPMMEEHLLTGPLEPTNEGYAIAKIAGLKLCQAYRQQHGLDYISVMPTNVYGIGDDYDDGCHVIPALINRFHQAKVKGDSEVAVWGHPDTRREFIYADDLAKACVLLMCDYSDDRPINIGFGSDVTIRELAETVENTVFGGALSVCIPPSKIIWDETMPVGTPRKLLDSSRIFSRGWRPMVSLWQGLARAYADYLERYGAKSRQAATGEQKGTEVRDSVVSKS